MELIESLHPDAVSVQDSPYEANYVIYNIAEKKTWCGCCRFAFSAILCRHLLGVFILADTDMILEPFIIKRWTKRQRQGQCLLGAIWKMRSTTQIL
jgi:hypothetical protein